MLNKIVSSEINSYVLFFRIQQYLLPQILQRTEVPEALPRFLEMSYRKQIRKLMFWLLLFVWLLLLELSFTLEFVFDPWEFSSFDGSVVTVGFTFELYLTTITGENEYNVTVTLPL